MTKEMTKDKFNSLNIHDKVEFINSRIGELGSAKNVCEAIGFNPKTFTEQVRNIYTYVSALKKYILISDLESIGSKKTNSDTSNEIEVYAPEHPQSISLNSIDNAQEKMLNILSNYDKIMKAIEIINSSDAPGHTSSISSNSNTFMDLNMPSSMLKKTTIRVNEDIWNDFKSCIESEFGHLEQFDLISVALRDFVNKYSVLK